MKKLSLVISLLLVVGANTGCGNDTFLQSISALSGAGNNTGNDGCEEPGDEPNEEHPGDEPNEEHPGDEPNEEPGDAAFTEEEAPNDGEGEGDGEGEHEDDPCDDEGEHEEEPPCEGDAAAQEAAILALGEGYCETCNPADGTAEELQAHLNPQDYSGGALEVGLVIGNPEGLAGVTTYFAINEIEIAIPADAWKLSEDGTRGRVVLLLETGLPTGEYFARLKVFAGEHAAGSSASWLVGCGDNETPHEEPGDAPADEPNVE